MLTDEMLETAAILVWPIVEELVPQLTLSEEPVVEDAFGFTLIGEPESDDAPEDLEPEIAEALRELDKARGHLIGGRNRAAIEYAADAVNRIAAAKGLHGYASY